MSAMAATIPVAAIAITTPATAAVVPDSASSRRRGGLIGSGKPLGRNGPARCVTSRRYASAPGLGLVHSCSTSSRSSSGGPNSGTMPCCMAGRSAPLHAVGADVALVDVTVDLLAVRRGQLAVPAVEQHVQVGAGPPAGARHQQRPERLLQPAASPRGQVVRLVPRHAEHGRQVGALQVVPQVELDDLAFGRVQAVQGGADELAQFGLIGVPPGTGPAYGSSRSSGLVQAGLRPVQPQLAFVAGHRVEPGPQLARVA